MEGRVGSRRVAQRPAPVTIIEEAPPAPVPAAVAAPAVPPPAALPHTHAPLVTAPSKRRRSSIKVPEIVPFPSAWFEGAVNDATADELETMLVQLDKRELQLAAALEDVEMQLLLGDDLQKRAELEAKFADLCKKEEVVMKELTAIRQTEQ